MNLKIFSIALIIALTSPNTWSKEILGSSFNEVFDVISDKNFEANSSIESKEFSEYQNGKLPHYPVNSLSIFKSGDAALTKDAIRTVNQRFDYYDRLPKKLHPNGVCVTGLWTIDQKTPYTGMLATGSQGLFVGRISVAMEDTEQDSSRGFGFAGKVFPTINPNLKVLTGNFFTVDVLMGTDLKHALDAKMTNEPEVGFQFNLIGLGLRIGAALSSADNNPGFRPLTQLAAASLQNITEPQQPKWIRVRASSQLKHNNQKDFRNEILTAMDENSNLKYFIEVSDTTKDRNAQSGWRKIGEINLDTAVVSYGCDRRLHFAHPKIN